jgi:signal transduction histidine kinase
VKRRTGSISSPIIYGSASVALTAALLVGWIYVILKNQEMTQQWVGNLWLLVAGIISFLAIMTVLVLFSVFLARQILEIRRQTTFIDSVTHELRSPLASIRLGLETMNRGDLADAQRAQLRDMMLGDVERLSAFIDDILEATRLEHGTSTTRDVSDIAFADFAESIATGVARRHKVAPESIEITTDDDLQLTTDPTALEIILKNLLDNAVKYSDDPVHVTVRARRSSPKRMTIEVEDQGVGIPRGLQRRIFERFYRVDEEAVRARRGTGLGLYVVKALVKSLGGKLSAYSEGPGKGTRMRIELPVITTTSKHPSEPMEEAAE